MPTRAPQFVFGAPAEFGEFDSIDRQSEFSSNPNPVATSMGG